MVTERSSTLIRTRLEQDLPELGRVLTQVHHRDGYPVMRVADPVAWLQSDQMIGAWVAEMDGRPVGQVALSNPTPSDDAARLWTEQTGAEADSIAVLGRLFVSSEARGHQLGGRLITAALEHARSIGRRAVLDVMAKDEAAIRTYERLAWRQLGPITHHFGDGKTAPAFAYVSPEA